VPEISVVIPVYNKSKYIAQTVESVLQQNFDDFEIILINDGSTDRSGEILSLLHNDKIRVFHQNNKGVSYTRNRGVSLAKSDLIAFLDADDYWYPNHLAVIHQLAKKFEKAAFFSTAYEIKYHDELIREIAFEQFSEEGDLLSRYYQYITGPHLFFTSNFAVRKNIFEKEGGFNEQIHGEDIELFLRLGIKYAMAYSKTLTLRYENFADESLFAAYNIDKRTLIDKMFIDDEKTDHALKKYMDLNRFSWILDYKISGNSVKAKELIQKISKKNLNTKQKILLALPGSVLRNIKNFQRFLIRNNIYLTSFSK